MPPTTPPTIAVTGAARRLEAYGSVTDVGSSVMRVPVVRVVVGAAPRVSMLDMAAASAASADALACASLRHWTGDAVAAKELVTCRRLMLVCVDAGEPVDFLTCVLSMKVNRSKKVDER